jgi:aspartyl/asparaginyl-tRNA synthetase
MIIFIKTSTKIESLHHHLCYSLLLSAHMSETFVNLGELTANLENQIIRTKGRLHVFRKQGSIFFLVLRHQLHTLQCVIFKNNKVLGLELAKLSPESYLEITGKLVRTPTPINSTSIKDVEIHVESYTVISH